MPIVEHMKSDKHSGDVLPANSLHDCINSTSGNPKLLNEFAYFHLSRIMQFPDFYYLNLGHFARWISFSTTPLLTIFFSGSRKMLPCLSGENGIYRWLGNSILLHKHWNCHNVRMVAAAYCNNIHVREFCRPVLFPSTTPRSPLFNFVVGIVRSGSKEKMFRIAARWVVALVKDAKTFWNLSVGKFIGNPAGNLHLSSNRETPVSVWRPATRPLPAFIGSFLINFSPEPFRQTLSSLIPSSNRSRSVFLNIPVFVASLAHSSARCFDFVFNSVCHVFNNGTQKEFCQ